MSSYWISNEAEEVLKMAHKHYSDEKANAKDRKELAFASFAELATDRLIRKKPVSVNECPACRARMMIKHNFCPHCGQALDWRQEG